MTAWQVVNSSGNVLQANTVRRNGGPFDGIGVFGTPSTANQVVGNLVELNNIARFAPQIGLMLNLDDGINLGSGLAGGSHTTVASNTIRGNGLNGIDACSTRGNPCITTDDAIVGNRSLGNATAFPDFFFDLEDISLNYDCDSNVWLGNTVTTAAPACAAAGGHQVPPTPGAALKASLATTSVRPSAQTGPAPGRHFPSS